MASGKFVTVFYCIDCRTHLPVSNWIKENYSVDYVDTITEPGPDKVFLEKNNEKIEQIKSKLLISIKAHNSTLVAIAGHYDCAANPISKDEHLIQIRSSISLIKSWNLPVKVIGLWISDQWKVQLVDE